MNTMKNGAYPITLNGEEYGLLFSLNALDEMQERFGGYDKLHEVFNQSNKDWVKDTRWLFTLLINEARLAEDENAETLSEQKVGRLINAGNLPEIQKAIFAAFTAGTTGNESQNSNTEETEGEMQAAQKK